MKKTLLFLAIAGLINLSAKAQTVAEPPHCFTTEYYNEEIRNNPQILQTQKELEDFTKQFIQNQAVQRSSQVGPYIIPIVFHILHNYGPENLSDDIIRESVRQINIDFAKLNADTINIVPSFIPIAAACSIEFRLATIDPFGNCTNGIEHIWTTETYLANDSAKRGPNRVIWPNNKYLNIWTANSLENSQAAAYAKPLGGNNNVDGVMCQYSYADNVSNTLTHEIGHCLNLSHTWGATNSPNVACGDDGVFDTPITKGFTQAMSCPLTAAICNPPIIENVQNYMDYSYCDNMFTYGQRDRMHACLNGTVNGRNNLWDPANLIATGTDSIYNTLCAPVADFKCDYEAYCAGDSVHFTDQSWKGVVGGWNWSFPGGNPSTSTDQNPSVAYTNAGVYTASLTVSNATGSDSITKTSIIRITADAIDSMPFTESFEDTASFPGSDGWIYNPDNGSGWSRVTNTASAGVASIKANNFINTTGAIDEWITPSIDFSNVGFPVMFTFKVANAQRNSTSADGLRLFYSLNCGQSWTSTSYNKSGSSLATAGIITSNFTPNNPSQWRQESVNVNPVNSKPNVRFKFQNTSDHGNNTYIDEINITGNIVGLDETDELQTGFAMYPNPTAGVTTIDFALTKSGDVNIEVKDILGRTTETVLNDNLGAGMHEYKLPVMPSGIYLVDVTVNNKHHIRKLVVSQ